MDSVVSAGGVLALDAVKLQRTMQESVLPPTEAVTVAVPGPTALTVPLPSTVATEALEVDQVTPCPDAPLTVSAAVSPAKTA